VVLDKDLEGEGWHQQSVCVLNAGMKQKKLVVFHAARLDALSVAFLSLANKSEPSR